MLTDRLFDDTTDDLLIGVYRKQGRTLDDLPYTPEFEAIYAAIDGGGKPDRRAEVFRRLHNLRKAKRLPRLGKAATKPLRVAPEHERLLSELVTDAIGQLSMRDRLLYSPQFDRIVQAFNARAGLSLSAHDVWRVVAKLAK